ncbi:MAG: CatB-related O-acetyltransferase [Clostridia bacterium]|nr:CatB-related O-acetyltransferase [Clostridia bacterium]
MNLKRIFQALGGKLVTLTNRKVALSAVFLRSQVDPAAAVGKRCRIFGCDIGRYTYIGRNCLVQNVSIGSFCSIAEGSILGLPSHPVDFVSTSPVFLEGKNALAKNFASIPYEDCPRTQIGHDVWVGAHAQIKSGVTVGTGAVVAAGAIVTHDVPPYAIVAGVPAKVLRYRFDEETIARLLDSRWWEMDDARLRQHAAHANDPQTFLKEMAQ